MYNDKYQNEADILFPIIPTKCLFSSLSQMFSAMHTKILKYPRQKYLVASIPFKEKRFEFKKQPKQAKQYSRDTQLSHYSLMIPRYTLCPWLCHKNTYFPSAPPPPSSASSLALDGLKDLASSKMKGTKRNGNTRSVSGKG